MKAGPLIAVAVCLSGCVNQPAGPAGVVPKKLSSLETALSSLQIDGDNRSHWSVSIQPSITIGPRTSVSLGPRENLRPAAGKSLAHLGWKAFSNLDFLEGKDPVQVLLRLVADQPGSGKWGNRYIVFTIDCSRLVETVEPARVSLLIDDRGASCRVYGMTARSNWTVWEGFPGKG